jgi:hypothetical protein
MQRMACWIFLAILTSWVNIQGCAPSPAVFNIEESLPKYKLDYYNDSFEKLREDLWERVGLAWNPDQLANLKIADMSVENGHLRIRTKSGGFSKGGLATKYRLRGDFDVQVDCRIDFLKGNPGIDQFLVFCVLERGVNSRNFKLISISLLKKKDGGQSGFFSSLRGKGEYQPGNWKNTDNFNGTLRIVRTGGTVTTLYRRKGRPEWTKMNTFPSNGDDATVAFAIQNFIITRKTIRASSTVTATFDNFRINAAREIIEEEI